MADYINVEWETGDWITKEKMNQMLDNIEYVKWEGPQFQTLFVGDVVAVDSDQTHTSGMEVYLSTSKYFQGGSGYLLSGYTSIDDSSGAATESSIIDHEIDRDIVDNEEVFITFYLDTGSTQVIYQHHCWITEETKYLSMWLTPFHITNTHGAHSVTILAHKETQGWA